MELIAQAPTPGKAKYLGRTVKMRPDWEQVKEDIMLTGLREKFKNPELREKLLDTGYSILIEGNYWHDNEWGDCYCENCQSKFGKNKLGRLLMLVREEIRNNQG